MIRNFCHWSSLEAYEYSSTAQEAAEMRERGSKLTQARTR